MTYRVLSLDGGGVWAILEAMALGALYGDMPGLQILANFDLAVANSGGSIVLAGLIENKTPSEIISLFSVQGNRQLIFAETSFIESLLSHIPIFPKYSAAGKLAGLTTLFGAQGGTRLEALKDSPGWPNGPNGQPVKVLITSFDYDALRSVFFRSYDTTPGATASQTDLVEAVHASSNAPVVYFDAPALFGGHRYWDGAMAGLNNPLMAGIVDLLAEGAPIDQIVALSIGSGTVKLLPPGAPGQADADMIEQPATQGVITDLSKAAGCINDDPPDNASYTAHMVLTAARGGVVTTPGAVVRLSPVVQPVLQNNIWTVPAGLDPAQFDALKVLTMDAVQQDQVNLLVTLGEAWIAGTAPNQAIRMASDTLACELGDDTFPAGKDRWLAMSPPVAPLADPAPAEPARAGA